MTSTYKRIFTEDNTPAFYIKTLEPMLIAGVFPEQAAPELNPNLQPEELAYQHEHGYETLFDIQAFSLQQ